MTPAALGLVVAACVCMPWVVDGGRLLLLDWVIGPHQPLLSRSAYGLDGGVASGVPLQFVLAVGARVLHSALTWLPIAAFFPVAAAGVARLCRREDAGLPGCVAAGALYAVNPFVFDRVGAGQIAFLLGYALLPYAVVSLLDGIERGWRGGFAPGLWIAALVACSSHFAWISAVIAVVMVAASRFRGRMLACLAVAAAVSMASSLYLVVGPVVGSHQIAASARADLMAYRTADGGSLTGFFHLLGLYGFWRQVPYEPRSDVAGWWLLLVALFFVAAIGFVHALGRSRSPRHRLAAVVMLASALLGLFLAMGDQGPTGPVFRWAYLHLHAFQVMREPQKFDVLVALALAAGFGWGVEAITSGMRRRSLRAVATAGMVALVIGYTPTLFWGLDGHLTTSHAPPEWSEVDARTGADAQSVTLFLPWHLYLAFPFTDGRVVINPASAYLRGRVISGDNVELPNVVNESPARRSAYIVQSMARARDGSRDFARRMAPLGITNVVLAKTADWSGYPAWLERQRGLVKVMDTSSLSVWRVQVTEPSTSRVYSRSTTRFAVAAGAPGVVTVPEPFDAGWRLGDQRPEPTPQGVMEFRAGTGPDVVAFSPWTWVRLGYLCSIVVALASAIAVWLCRPTKGGAD